MKKHLLFLSLVVMMGLPCQILGQNPATCTASLPYHYSFNNSTQNACWTVVDNNNDGTTFHFNSTNGYAYYQFSSSNSADDWVISPVFQFTGNEILCFDYRSNSINYHERFQVFALGADTIPLTSVIETNSTSYQTVSVDLSALNGSYQIGFHCVSIPNQYNLYFTNLHICAFPLLVCNKDEVNFGLHEIGTSSPSQQLIMQSLGNSSPITVTVPDNYEVSLDMATFGSSLTFPANGSNLRKDTFYVRFTPTIGGPINRQLVISSGTEERLIPLYGLVHACNDTMTLPFREGFEDSFTYCWTILDQDGDSTTWQQRNSTYYAYSGSKYIYSQTHYDEYTEEDILQDNWLISQPVYISDTAILSYYVDAMSWSFVNYSVYVSTTGNNLSDFSLLFADSSSTDNYNHRMISLEEYVGQTIYLAFRTHSYQDCMLDDITIATLDDQPMVVASPNYINCGSLAVGYGDVRTFQVETYGPVGNIGISGTSGCEFSVDGIHFASTVTLPDTGGTVYVRITLTTTGYKSENVTIAAQNADPQYVELYARGLQCYNAIPYTHNFNNSRNECWSTINANADGYKFTFSQSSGYASLYLYSHVDVDDWLVSPLFELNGNQYGFFDYRRRNAVQNPVFLQVYALGVLDTIPISPVLDVTNIGYERLYFDLSSLQGSYHVGIRTFADTFSVNDYLYITHFNVQNLTPLLAASPDTLDFGNIFLEENYLTNSVAVTTVDYAGPVTITVPAPFEVSTDGGVSFGTTKTIPADSATVRYDTVLVRMFSSVFGSFDGWMSLSATGLSDSVWLTGIIPDCHNAIPYFCDFSNSAWNDCWTIIDANNDGKTFSFDTINKRARETYSYSYTADDWLISPYFTFNGTQYGSMDYKLSSSSYTHRFEVYALGQDTVLLTPMMEVSNVSYKTLTWNFSALQGDYRIGIHCTTLPYQYYLYLTNFTVKNYPTVEAAQDALAFSLTNVGNSSASQQVVMRTVGVTTPISITAPTHFEVSADGENFSSQCSIPADTAFLATDTFFVRFAPLQRGTLSGQLVLSAAGATDTVVLTGLARDCADTLQLPFIENFEGAFNHCWTALDLDGDGQTWEQTTFSSSGIVRHCMISETHFDDFNNDYLDQDNWLISQPIYLSDTAFLSYYARSQSFTFFNLPVYISTTGNNVSDFSLLFSDNINDSYDFKHEVVSLADYVGQTIYLAFRFDGFQNCLLSEVTIATKEEYPLVTVTPYYLYCGTLPIGYGEVRSLQVTTYGPVGNLVVSGSSDCEFSVDGTNFATTVTMPSTGGTVYARITPISSNYIFSYMTVSAANAEDQTVHLGYDAMDCYNAIPYTHNFNNNRNACWSRLDANGDGTYYDFSTYYSYARLYVSANRSIDDWLISPSFNLDGNQYGFFDYKGGTSNHVVDNFQVFALGALDTIPLTPIIHVVSSVYERVSFDLSSLQGTYHVGIRSVSDTIHSYQYLYITNFNIQNITPSLEFSLDTLDFAAIPSGFLYDKRQMLMNTMGIHEPITLSVSAPYEISLDGVNFSSTIVKPADSAGLSVDTVTVRLLPTTEGTFNGMITATTTSLSDTTVITGSVISCQNTIPYVYNFDNSMDDCWTVVDANNDTKSFTFTNDAARYAYSTVYAADDWLISSSFLFSGNQYGSFLYKAGGTSYPERFVVVALGNDTIALTDTIVTNKISYQKLPLLLTSLQGYYKIGIHCISNADMYYLYIDDFQLQHFNNGIVSTPQTVDFGMVTLEDVPVPQQVTVLAEGVFTPLMITAPAQFEISLDNSTYVQSLTIPVNGTGFDTTLLYVRYNPAVVGLHDAPLTIVSDTMTCTVPLYGAAFNCNVPVELPLVEDFEDALDPCWQILDHDGDGNTWVPYTHISHSSQGMTGTYASSSNMTNSPDNWLVSPKVVPTANTILTFYEKGFSGKKDVYSVYVATNNTVSAFLATTPVYTGFTTNDWQQKAVSLGAFAGDTVYVAFRHYNSANQFKLVLDDIVITNSLDNPVVMLDSVSLDFGTVVIGESVVKSQNLTVFGSTANVVATTSVPFQISSDGLNFSPAIVLPNTGGTFYVKYTPTSETVDNGTVSILASGATNQTVTLHGAGFDCYNTIPYSFQFDNNRTFCWTIEDANQDGSTFYIDTIVGYAYYDYNSQNVANDWLISPVFTFNGGQYGSLDYRCSFSSFPERFEVLALGADTITLSAPIEANETTFKTLLIDMSPLTGAYRIGIHCISDADQYQLRVTNFNIQNFTPSISVNVDTLDFGMVSMNGHSETQQVVLTKMGFYASTNITAPAQYEVSADGISFASTLTCPVNSSLIAYDTIYVRFSPTVTGSLPGTLAITAGNHQASVFLTGMSRDCDAVASVPFAESFEGYNNYCWTMVDGDNDGYTWRKENNSSYAHSGTDFMMSESYTNTTHTSLCPDNWLISQAIQLPAIPAQLSFWVRSYDNYYSDEQYAVYVSTTGNSVQDFTDQVFSSISTYSYQQKAISLRDYAGQTVYIAFRHYNTCDQYRLILDDIAIQLDTTPQLPLVATDSVTAITQLSAAGVGHIVFDGNTAITDRGFCWSTVSNPTLADNHVSSPTSSDAFMGFLVGLSEHATYHLRAYATNSFGTVYGEEVVFTTLCGPATQTSFNQTACESFSWNGITYETSGDYAQTLENMIGCDSIVTMHLTIYHGDSTEFVQVACESYTWDNTEFTATGDYTRTFATVHGCDSVVTLHLTIHHGDSTEFSQTVCESYTWDNTIYTASGDYYKTYANEHGCDSVVTLHLTVHYGDSTEFTQEVCDSFVWDDSTYTVSGDYTNIYPNMHGCDSVVTLHLTVHYGDSTEFTQEVCDSFVWDDSTYTQTGDYVRTYETIHGCDSIVTMHLTVHSSVTNEIVISCPDSCYEWNGQTYCTTGDYTQLLQTVYGCDSTVTMHLTITVGVTEIALDPTWHVYPNPTNGMLNVSGKDFTQIRLFDAYGKQIGVWDVAGEVTQINLTSYASGIYFVKVMNGNRIVGVRKVVKQ